MYVLNGAAEIADVLGTRAAVCCYGPYLGLTADRDGDVSIERTEEGVRFASQLLCQQLAPATAQERSGSIWPPRRSADLFLQPHRGGATNFLPGNTSVAFL